MKKTGKRGIGLLLALTVLLSMLFAVPVSAEELDEATSTALCENVQNYLEQVFALSDDNLLYLREEGDFYEIMVDAWLESREETGAFLAVTSIEAESSDNTILVTANVDFETLDAEIVMYFDETGSTPTNFVINVEYPMSTKLMQAAQNTVIGLVIVFLVLLFLAGVISLFRYLNPDSRKQAGDAAEPVRPAEPEAELLPSAAAAVDENEIQAVIAAAIAAYEADCPTAGGDGYVVRSIRKVGTAKNWKRA